MTVNTFTANCADCKLYHLFEIDSGKVAITYFYNYNKLVLIKSIVNCLDEVCSIHIDRLGH